MVKIYEPGDQIATPGTTYRVVRVLGHGGMGSAFEVVDKNLNRRVVLKLAHEECAVDPEARDRFNREARAMAQVRHRNVVQVTLLGQLQDAARTPFYVMELLEGQSLKAILSQKPKGLRIDIALQIALQILHGLDAIHERGIVHRDIKPDNIILHRDEAGRTAATIIDFGIMMLVADGARPTVIAYSPPYAAPEQLKREELGPQADIFALGLVLFEMLTGHRPYKDYGAGEAGALARLDVAAPPITAYGSFPPALAKVVASMLALSPKERTSDALSAIRDLEKIANALVGLDLHEAVTDPQVDALNEPLAAAATGARTITQADLANPTDVDADIPLWMQALRERNKREAVLGYANTEPSPPPLGASVDSNDTDRMPLPVFASASASASEPAPVASLPAARPGLEPVAISTRPAAKAIEVTHQPRQPLAPPASRDLVYVDPPPRPFQSTMPMSVPAVASPSPPSATVASRADAPNVANERGRSRAKTWFVPESGAVLRQLLAFVITLVIIVSVALFFIRRSFPERFGPAPTKAGSP